MFAVCGYFSNAEVSRPVNASSYRTPDSCCYTAVWWFLSSYLEKMRPMKAEGQS